MKSFSTFGRSACPIFRFSRFHYIGYHAKQINRLAYSGAQNLLCRRCMASMERPKDASALKNKRNFSASRSLSNPSESIMKVFDRNAKRIHRNITALDPNYEVYDYIKEEMGWRMADRMCDVKRKFEVAVDLGCGRGHIAKNIMSDMVGKLYMTDMAEKVLEQAEVSPEVPTYKIIADEEFIPFKPNSLDLVISSLSLHWVNDLPGTFKQVNNTLKNDGCFIGALYASDTLYELRCSLQLAENEREGGFASHISPFTSPQDLGGLLNRAGFVMTTIDLDDIVVRYPSMFELLKDLKGMGENNCSWNRRNMIPRETLVAAAAIYKEMYGGGEEGVPATFQILHFIGWKPDPSQKQAAKRGSGQVSLKDIDRLDELSAQIEKVKAETKDQEGAGGIVGSVDQLASDLEKLRLATMKNDKTDSEK